MFSSAIEGEEREFQTTEKENRAKKDVGEGGEVEIVKKKATYIVHGLPSPVKTVAKVLYSGHFTMPDRI